MKRKYKQLSSSQRHLIEFMLKQGKKQREIAKEIGVSPSTISREIKRNGSPIRGKYTAEQAQKRRDERRKNSNKKPLIENNPKTMEYVHNKMREGWSPEMIEQKGRMEKKAGLLDSYVPCKETIYRYVYRSYKEKKNEELIHYLRTRRKRRRKRGLKKGQRGIIRDRVFIDQRPKVINERLRIGDWEIDTIEGKGHN